VAPPVPVRQWVLSLPKRLRWHLHRDPALTTSVLRLFLRAVERTLLAHSETAPTGARMGAVNTVVFSRNSKLLVSGSDDATVKIWNVTEGRQVVSLAGHQSPVRSVAISPNGKTLVTGGEDSRVLVCVSIMANWTKYSLGTQTISTHCSLCRMGAYLFSREA